MDKGLPLRPIVSTKGANIWWDYLAVMLATLHIM
jgi:hypothetical protein